MATRGRTVKPVHYQTGRTHKAPDQHRHPAALKPGRRISRNGKPYTETRQNRSDLNKRRRL